MTQEQQATLSPDELRKQLALPYGEMQEGFQETPLQEFIGLFTDYQPDRNPRFPDRLQVLLKWTGVEVIKATDTYPFDVAQFHINFSKTKQSAYGMFIQSIDRIIPGGTIASIVNKKTHMKLVRREREDFKQKDEAGNPVKKPWDVWEVVEIVGAVKAGKSPKQVLLEMAVGRDPMSLDSFYQDAFKNAVVKTDKELIPKILGKSFVSEALESGSLVIAEDGKLALGS